MKHNTKIEWTQIPGFTGETWNPIVGCSVVSPGCKRCYAMAWAERMAAMGPKPHGTGNIHLMHYQGTVTRDPTGRGYAWSEPVWTGKVAMAGEAALTKPLRWAKPRAVFVNSMGDLFHESVPDAWIDRVFAVMALCPQHIFIVLTKRAERMRAYFADMEPLRISDMMHDWGLPVGEDRQQSAADALDLLTMPRPLPNVWLGVSAEDQTRADERIPHLLATPAAVRFVSCEPLLGPVDLARIVDAERDGLQLTFDALTGLASDGEEIITGVFSQPDARLDWVIAGGESGPGARPMHPEWARGLRDQCKAAGVPFFFKQWGEWFPGHFEPGEFHADIEHDQNVLDRASGRWVKHAEIDGQAMGRIGKRAAGHKLDDETHHNWPEVGA